MPIASLARAGFIIVNSGHRGNDPLKSAAASRADPKLETPDRDAIEIGPK
jgi:hypothetical protein